MTRPGLLAIMAGLLLITGITAFATGEADQEAGAAAQKEILFWDTATPGSPDHLWLTEQVEKYHSEHPDVTRLDSALQE